MARTVRFAVPVATAVALLAARAAWADEEPKDEAPPVCIAGGPYVGECAGVATYIPVDGSASYDPDGTAVSFRWQETCDWLHVDDPTSAVANVVYENDGTCSRWCELRLKVTSGSQFVICGTVVTLQDTTPPTLTIPADVTDIWGIATEPASLGFATATDTCDYLVAPTVTYADAITPQQGPGHEQTIKRTWSAVDRCENVVQAVQTITLLSPAVNCKSLDLNLNTCPDSVDIAGGPTFSVTVLGRPGTQASGLILSSLKLARLGDQINYVYPYAYTVPADTGRFLAVDYGDCNVPGTDGRKDVRLDFDLLTVSSVLALDTVAPGDPVYVMVTGLRNNLTPYFAATVFTVQ
jgi:hypothetical protein